MLARVEKICFVYANIRPGSLKLVRLHIQAILHKAAHNTPIHRLTCSHLVGCFIAVNQVSLGYACFSVQHCLLQLIGASHYQEVWGLCP